MSANRINIGKEAFSLDYDDAKGAYSKVRIIIDERADPYEYGTNDGRTFEIKNPWIEYPPNAGETRENGKPYADTIAADILSRLNGYEYQPFDAHGAFLPDNTELGDAVVVGGVYGAIVSQDITFDGLGNSDVSAPNGEDNENEFGDYVPSADSSTEAQIARLRTSFIVQYGLIQSTIESLDENLSSQIEQRLDSISLSVSSSGGTTSFVLKDGSVTLDSETVDLHVKALNIDGLISANQIEAISVKAEDLYGGNVHLYVPSQDTYISAGTIGYTVTNNGDYGISIDSNSGIRIEAHEDDTSHQYGNVFISGGGAYCVIADTVKYPVPFIQLRQGRITFGSTPNGASVVFPNSCYGSYAPNARGVYSNITEGSVYFQLVT